MIKQIGRYEITGELGKGAMGVVYKATDPNIGRTVALKTLRLDLEGTEAQELLARFKNEARAAGLLNHRNIITIYDAGEHENLFYIAMELIGGATLQHKLKQGRVLPVEEIVSVASQVCAGLDYAHSKGVIHRDIKPANIMIEADGTAKIMDFGIAKAGASLTTTGQVVGTPNYMSPEQVRGKLLDGRSDLFSLGVVLYEMVTGERPFTGDNVTTIVYKIVNEHPPEPRALDVTVHPGLNSVVMKALAKSPDQRYQTGAEMARDLHNFKALGTEATMTTVLADPAALAPAAAPAHTLPPPATGASSARMPATPPSPPVAAAPPSLPPPRAAALPSLAAPDSTVSAPMHRPQPPTAPKARSSGPMLAAVIGVVLVAIVGGGYLLKTRRGAGPAPAMETQPATTSNSAPPAVPSATTPTTPQEAPGTVSAPDTGELSVTSSPEAATVLIDGRNEPKWTTPFTAPRLTPGPHSVVVSKGGYKSETRRVEVEAGKRASVSVGLKPAGAVFAVKSDPPGASIFLDGKPTGQITPARLPVAPGQHKVGLVLEGYKPERIMADAGAGQTLNIGPTLQPQDGGRLGRLRRFLGGGAEEKGFIEVRTRPKGAEIWIGEMKAPMKTPARIPINAGNYRITLRLRGFKPVTRNVTVEKGKTYGIDEILERQ